MISILTDSGAELAIASRRQIVYKAQDFDLDFNPGNRPPRATRPHKAHECAFDEKHPVRRVGDAEGALAMADLYSGISHTKTFLY
jgi:hypothetical protein